jgi:hypothetical protein
MKIVTYTPDQFEAMRAEQQKANADSAAWLAGLLKTVADALRRNPGMYRTFGPWWWPLKGQLVAAGMLWGEEPPPSKVEDVTTGSAVDDMLAAIAYHGFNVEQMVATDRFTVGTDDGDTVDYVLADPDMDDRRLTA